MFFEDAKIASQVLELTLTGRDCGEEQRAPMCGVPFHSAEQYIKRLIDRGFKVAICEQLTDPHASKGLVERGVIRLVTAGTVTEASMLTDDSNNYITSIFAEDGAVGLAFADISTGEIHVFEKSGKNIEQEIIAELSRFNPVELLINKGFLDLKEVHSFVTGRLKSCVCEMPDENTFDNSDLSVITAQFENKSDIGQLGISSMRMVQRALCALFRYVGEAHKATVKRFVELTAHSGIEYMDLGLSLIHI